jgi:hypothetical protein
MSIRCAQHHTESRVSTVMSFGSDCHPCPLQSDAGSVGVRTTAVSNFTWLDHRDDDKHDASIAASWPLLIDG